ncbi:MAG: class I SAM-dependent methyltransferase [Candidatus Alcyoniella australis]|nr:class I SAM-dependent methyltransferase [Candidatus Alcyoniella australis]
MNNSGNRITKRPWICPSCGATLLNLGDVLICTAQGLSFPRRDGLIYLLAPGRAESLESRLPRLAALRKEEGLDLGDYDAPASLPEVDPDNPWASLWEQRAISWRAAVEQLDQLFGSRRLRLIDLGAASCWMSLRLAQQGHDVLACDPCPDGDIGLGAAGRLAAQPPFERVVCELERLPLGPGCVDAVLCSGALHHAQSVDATLEQAQRVLAPGGALLIFDSPLVRFREDGQRMVRGLAAEIEQGYGLPPWVDEPFFVRDELEELLRERGFEPRFTRPRRGWRWRANSLASALASGGTVAEYPLVVATKLASDD